MAFHAPVRAPEVQRGKGLVERRRVRNGHDLPRGIVQLLLVTFRCRTRATDPVFIRSACVRTRPNAPIPLTIDTVIWTCPDFIDTWVTWPVLRIPAAARTLGD